MLGREFEINTQLSVGAQTEIVQVVGEATPLVDTRSTLIGHNVSAEEFDRLPKGRSFQSIAFSAPSVSQGEVEGGFQVNGASGAENSFTVDGIVTNSLVNGQSRQNTVFEYLQEVQVKTSGISAEYGGALGGVVSAVTKSGGNTFRGEAPLLLRGQRARGRPGGAARARSADRAHRLLRAGRGAVEQDQRDGRLDRRPDRARPPLLLRRLLAAEPEARPTTTTSPTAPGDIDRSIWTQQTFGKLSFASRRVNASCSVLVDADQRQRHAHRLRRCGAERAQPQRIRCGGEHRPRLRDQPGQRQRLGRRHAVQRLVPQLPAAASSTTATRTRACRTVTSYTYGNSTTSVNAIIPPSLQGATGFVNTPRAQITEFDTTKRNELQHRLQPLVLAVAAITR